MVAPRMTRKKRPQRPVQMFVPPPQTVAPTQPTAPASMFAAPLQAAAAGAQRGPDFVPGASTGGSTGGMTVPVWGQMLQGLGIGLLTGDDWGEGLGQGLLYANQFGQQYRQEEAAAKRAAREDERFGFEKQKYQTELDQAAAQKAERDALDQSTNMFLAPWLNDVQGDEPPGVNLTPQSAMFLSQLPVEQRIEALSPIMMPQAKDGPSSVQEYEYAKQQGFKGSLLDYQTAKARAGAASSSTTIYNKDYGNIPPGFRLVETPQGVQMEAVPGSPAAAEIKTGEEKKAAQVETKKQTADIVTEELQRALKLDESAILPTTGFAGNLLQNVPSTAAHDKARLIDTVKANIGFDKIQQMRNESPTGGALGQVAVQELMMLQATAGSLEQSQSKPQWDYNAMRLHDMILDVVHGPGNGPARLLSGGSPRTKDDQPSSTDDGYTVEELP